MDQRRLQRIEELFHIAVDLPPHSREEALHRLCDGDDGLHQEVARMIERLHESPSFLEGSAGSRFDVSERNLPVTHWRIGQRIGDYELSEKIGIGGMGTVFRAHRFDGTFDQEVAIKLATALENRPNSPSLRRRFLDERQHLADLDHPNICRLIDGGTSEEGIPYLVMEFVHGLPIDEFCRTHDLSPNQRLRLMITVCSAVQSAHNHLVVHRDLKPANILVHHDEQGLPTPKLLDFGIAKLIEHGPDVNSRSGTEGVAPFTLRYASPEQIRGEPITTATDVYSLSVLLFELVTGENPHDLQDASPFHAMQRICEEEPRRPRNTPADLEHILLKGLQRDPSTRYPSPIELAQDLENFMTGRPISARVASPLYVFQRFCGRHRGALVTLGVFFTVASLLFAHAIQSNREARRSDQAASLASDLMDDLLSAPNPYDQWGPDIRVLDLLDTNADSVILRAESNPLAQAQILNTLGHTYSSLEEFEKADSYLHRATALFGEYLGEDDEKTLTARNGLALLDHRRGRYPEAAETYRAVLKIRQDRLGPSHPATLSTIQNLATTLNRLGRPQESEEILRAWLPKRTLVSGEDHRDSLDMHTTLVVSLIDQGRFHDALPLCQNVLARKTQTLGSETYRTLISRLNLAVIYGNLERYRDSHAEYQRALKTARDILPPNHSFQGRIQHNIGAFQRRTGNLEGAAQSLRHGTTILEDVLGPSHATTLEARHGLACTLHDLGRFDDARAEYETLVTILEESELWESGFYNKARRGLATITLDKGDAKSAQRVLEEILEDQHAASGYLHPDTLTTVDHLVSALKKQDKILEATDVCREALLEYFSPHRPSISSKEGPHALAVGTLLCIFLIDHDGADTAEAVLSQILDELKESGHSREITRLALHNLAHLKLKKGDIANARKLCDELMEIARADLTEGDSDLNVHEMLDLKIRRAMNSR